MSWSISYIGSPEKIIAALDRHSESISGKSKEEFDDALPHIKALVNMNSCKNYTPVLRVGGNGHAHDGYSQCNVSLLNY